MGKEIGGTPTQPTPGAAETHAVTPSSERSDGDSWSRKGDVSPQTLSPAGISFAGEAEGVV